MGTLVFQATLGGAVNIIGPNIANTINFTLPSADGTSGQTWTTNGSGVLAFGTLGIAGGGTGQITATAAFNALAPSQSGQSGKYLTTDGTNTSWGTNPLGTVTSVGGTGTVNGITLTGTVTTSGNLTLGGTLSGVSLTTQVTGILPTANGGTNLTSFTSGGVVYASSTGTLATGSALLFNGTSLGIGASPTATLHVKNADLTSALLVGSQTDSLSWGMFSVNGDTSSATGAGMYGKASASLYFNAPTSYAHVWTINGGEIGRFNTTGLGIGTSSPAAKLDVNGDALIYGVKVGRGGGSVASNTVVGGHTPLNSNTTGTNNVAIGDYAGNSSTGSFNTLLGSQAGFFVTGSSNVLAGYQAGNNGGLSGSYNVGIGQQALYNNTTASNNTAVGYQSAYTNSTGTYNTVLGFQAGYTNNNNFNVFIGSQSGYYSTGYGNVFISGGNTSSGYPAGFFITGSDNIVIGGYGGNQDGLDIRTSSSYVVLATGNGNRLITSANGQTVALQNAVPNTGTGITFPATQYASSNANTLDDYEEGTWTPALGGFSSITYSAQTGTYTKIGNVVNVVCKIVVSGGTRTSADLQIFSLPFTSASQENSGGSWGYGYGVVASTVGLPQLRINASGTTVSLLNTAGVVLAGTDLNTATPTINFSATYTV